MISVSSKVKLNNMRIKQLTNAAIVALEQTTEALHTEVVQAQVIPRDTGALQNESTFVDYSKAREGKTSIVSATPYARRLYYHPEYNFSKNENPNARGKWYEQWISGKDKDFCRNAFKELYRRAGGL